MKKIILGLLFFCFCMMGSNVHAYESDFWDNFAISPRVELGATYYLLDFEGSGGSGDSVSSSYFDVTLGSTAFYDRFAMDIYVRLPIAEIDDEVELGGDINETASADIDRFEFGTVLSYQITQQIGAFVGFRYGNTEAKDDSVFMSDFEFEVKGVTFGGNYGFVVNKHVFNFVLGGGYMNGELSFGSLAGQVKNEEVDALGFVAAAKYRYLINDEWDFRVVADGYYFDFGSYNILENGLPEHGDLTEETYSLRMGLTYTF